ncbi:MAG TPA: beta-eliminating lyase-related protein [Saprospiraceae bacterium]|nr:beta-eliminating lyase-related protein [Saprospiraceae bacterium]HQW57119.1 beta-eliminating lyase-related protein [Saprospiraceae bacterium]
MKSLASDNYAGVIPEVLSALSAVNNGHESSYGSDSYTTRVGELFNNLFEKEVRTLFAFNGTGANLLGLSSVLQPYQSILCTHMAHLNVDESTAPELMTGCRIRPLETDIHGKLTPEAIRDQCIRKGDVHFAQPAAVTITQSTEYGTLYTLDEISAIREVCNEFGLLLHLDGARILNALVAMDCSAREMLTATGVDVMTFGITKAGTIGAEAVVYINDKVGESAGFFQKRNAQLASKARYIAAQFMGMMEHDVWRNYALHANDMAQKLRVGLHQFDEITITMPVEANAVFAIMPTDWIKPLQNIIPFYIWNEKRNEVRLMCSWDTTASDINLLVEGIKKMKAG